ncbi:hypothetical protein PCAR4_250008 [Paraburkholderia caribensis]|nr:hypothetical protein PCAR4_250008 [Paraburkholderia caribensis]
MKRYRRFVGGTRPYLLGNIPYSVFLGNVALEKHHNPVDVVWFALSLRLSVSRARR